MKTLLVLISLALLSGCAARTRITIKSTDGTVAEFNSGKNVKFEYLLLTDKKLEIKNLVTDASSVIKEKNVGVVAVTGTISDAAKAAAPLLIP